MKKFKSHTLAEYSQVLSKKEPVPGGGSASAYTGALGASLISMVARYSLGKGKSKTIENRITRILNESELIRLRLLELVDLDAQAYLKVVQAKKSSAAVKRRAAQSARKVPKEICRLCKKAIRLTPFLAQKGNPYLISDVAVAAELLMASFQSAKVLENC